MSRPRATARSIARDVLKRVRRDEAYANLALAAALDRAGGLSGADRALATELVYGVLRQQRLLDHVLARHVSRPLRQVDAEVLDALRVAAYQILRLERVPSYAAVDEAVEAVTALRGRKVAGFSNAVLRRVSAADLEAGLPDDEVARVALGLSLPLELFALLVEELGLEDASALGRSWLERAGLVARANVTKAERAAVIASLEAEGAVAVPGSWTPCAIHISELERPFRSRSYLGGLWSAQDEAAQLVSILLDPRPGERILDACAGVGGKTTHIAERAGGKPANEGLLALDISPRKLELLQEHARRLGLPVVAVECADLRDPGAVEQEAFDRVLLDAPCSGLGVLRRHPELKGRWQRARLQELVALQRQLLQTAVRALRRGGVLVYSVCTVTESEGPGQLRWLLSSFDDLEIDAPPATIAPELFEDGAMRTWPHRHGMDGFFAARLRRRAR